MDICVDVQGQKMKIPCADKFIAPRTHEFVRFIFRLSDEWSELEIFAQFAQDGKAYNCILDDEDSVYLPSEITTGECTMMLRGTGVDGTVGTTMHLTLSVTKDVFVDDEIDVEFTPTMYDQLMAQISQQKSIAIPAETIRDIMEV